MWNARIATNSLARDPSLHTFKNAKISLGKFTSEEAEVAVVEENETKTIETVEQVLHSK